jgi:hypothetical protein
MENESNKQTAVEWLFEQVWLTPISELPKILKQAKEMENAQKAHSFHLGMEAQRLIDKGKNGE